MKRLKGAGVVIQQGGSHGPYSISLRDEVARLLQANQNFLSANARAKLAATEVAGKRLNEAVMQSAGVSAESETA